MNEEFGQLDKWALRDLSHTLPEWEDPNGSCIAINPEDILRAANKSPEEIERIAAEAEELRFFNFLESMKS